MLSWFIILIIKFKFDHYLTLKNFVYKLSGWLLNLKQCLCSTVWNKIKKKNQSLRKSLSFSSALRKINKKFSFDFILNTKQKLSKDKHLKTSKFFLTVGNLELVRCVFFTMKAICFMHLLLFLIFGFVF